jgi:3-deoxy-7-phosphoheptulonate synthase
MASRFLLIAHAGAAHARTIGRRGGTATIARAARGRRGAIGAFDAAAAHTQERQPMTRLDDPLHDREIGVRDSTLDTTRIDDVRIGAVRPLITPALLQERVPVRDETLAIVESSRAAIAAVLHGRDDRLIVVVGPCSIHDHDQAIEYGQRLKREADALQRDLLIVMRTYFEKPRTTVGWKGYINDPHLDGSFAINDGLERARRLLLELTMLGLPTGTEFLDLLSPQFIADLIAWGAIGARTTESQSHRQLASGLSCPVGFKNGTDGSIKVAADAILAARAPHAFMGMTKMGMAAIFETRGNDDCHVILRGGTRPNYDAEHVDAACRALRGAGLREQVMVDVSHGNSGKDHRRQVAVAADVAGRIAGGDRRITGLMIESHLAEGRQDLARGVPLQRGVSITDACLGFEQTVEVLRGLADAVAARRRHRPS